MIDTRDNKHSDRYQRKANTREQNPKWDKFVSGHNQNNAYIKQAIKKVFIRKVLKPSKEQAQPVECLTRGHKPKQP